MELSTLYADAGYDVGDPYGDTAEFSVDDTGLHSERVIDVAANTRQVWYDYLAQFEIVSAILTVVLPGAAAQRHSFLIGLDEARGDRQTIEALMTLAGHLWQRIGEVPTHQFQISAADAAGTGSVLITDDAAGGALPHVYDCGIAIQMKRNGANIQALFFRRSGCRRFTDQEGCSLQLVAPLLADSAIGVAQLARQSRRSAMLEAMFDRVSFSMALLSADGQPLFLNSAAAAMVEQRKWLIRAVDGAIVAAEPQQAKQLRESIRRAATADTPIEDVFRLDCRNGDWRLVYVISARSRSPGGSARCAMVIIMGPGKVDAPGPLLEALGLLPSEQRFLGHFLRSSSLCNAAEGCGLSEETARTYLKRVRAKLGVHRQMELAGLISGLVLPLHAADPSLARGR
ncbi:MAG: hypothetical protein C0520_00940 [Sphingopyxis sp.]|nr:hypothetical protein [Sphingopyxis sp.]